MRVTPVVAAVLASALLGLPPASAAEQGTLADYGYGEQSLRGTYGSTELFVPLPAGERPAAGTRAVLDISASPVLTSRSTLTVLAGDVALTSVRLGPGTPQRRTVAVDVPPALVGPEGLALSVRGYLRATDDECEDPTNPALWATVHSASTVAVQTVAAPRELDDVAPLLVGRTGPSAVAIGLPAALTPEVLEAAGTVAAAVGRFQGARGVDAAVALAPATGVPTVQLAVGADAPGDLPARWTGSGFTTTTGPLAAGGVLALSQTGTQRLLVAGSTPEGLVDAALALHDPARRDAVGGQAVAVSGATAALPERSLPWQDGAASLAQLGLARQGVTGTGVRELFFAVDRPPGWALRDGARLDLVVDSSAALRDDSTVSVRVGGQDVGSRRLRAGDGPRTYGFDLPAGLLDRRLDGRPTRSLDLVVRFDLRLPQDACDPLDGTAATAAVLPTTSFVLPHDDSDELELGRFPAPLDRDGRVTVVLPESPEGPELAAGLQVAAALGRFGAADAPPPLLTTSDRVPSGAAGVVLLGTADEEVGERLDLGTAGVSGAAGSTSAVLAVVPSPLDEDRTALVVHGEGSGLLLAARALGDRDGLSRLRGSRVALTGGLPGEVLADAAEDGPPAELAPVEGGRSYLDERSYLVPAVVLLVAFLAVLGLLARYRWGRRSRA